MIVIHVACDDEAFRAVVADLLGHQRDMRVLRVSSPAADAAGAEPPDVVVYGISPRSEVTSHAPEFRDMASTGAAIVQASTPSSSPRRIASTRCAAAATAAACGGCANSRRRTREAHLERAGDPRPGCERRQKSRHRGAALRV